MPGSIGRIFGALVLVLAAGAAHAATIQVKIENLAFAPAEITVHAGDTIQWTNADIVVHTATARNGAFDVTIPVKGKASTVVKATGTVDYYCKFHPNMVGKIVVGK